MAKPCKAKYFISFYTINAHHFFIAGPASRYPKVIILDFYFPGNSVYHRNHRKDCL